VSRVGTADVESCVQVRSYGDLVAWQKSVDLVVAVYELTQLLPREEMYGLTSQMRRAAVSIPSNIAEGHGRASRGEYLNHLGVAYGSLMELETQILISRRLNYFGPEQVETLMASANEVGRLINGLSNSLRRSPWPLAPDP
jgi:four helix bundle protein